MLTKHILLPLTGQGITLHLRSIAAAAAAKRITTNTTFANTKTAGRRSCGERPAQFTAAPLQQVSFVAGPGNGRGLGHEVKVQKLHGFEFDVAGGRAGLEDGRDGEQTVELFKSARVLRGLEQGDDKDLEGGGLDGGAVDWFEEVEEEL